MTKPILSLDFDGVLHSYTSGWRGAHFIPDPPVPGAMAFLIEAVKHFNVNIFSSRSHQDGGIRAMQSWIDYWLDQEFGWDKGVDVVAAANQARNDLIYPTEKPAAMISIDDRALTFDGTWPAIETLLAFKPWNKLPKLTVGVGDIERMMDAGQAMNLNTDGTVTPKPVSQ